MTGINSYFYTDNLLIVNNSEYIKYNPSYFKSLTRQIVINNGKNNFYIDSQGRAFTLYQQNAPEYKNVKYTQGGKVPNGTIGENGCLLVSSCIISSGYGYKDTPKSIANSFYKKDWINSVDTYFSKKIYSMDFYISDTTEKEFENLWSKYDAAFRPYMLEALDYDGKILVTCRSFESANWMLKIGGKSASVENHAYTILDKRTRNGKIEVFYMDPEGYWGWSSLDGFDHISSTHLLYF